MSDHDTNPRHWFHNLPDAGAAPACVTSWERSAAERRGLLARVQELEAKMAMHDLAAVARALRDNRDCGFWTLKQVRPPRAAGFSRLAIGSPGVQGYRLVKYRHRIIGEIRPGDRRYYRWIAAGITTSGGFTHPAGFGSLRECVEYLAAAEAARLQGVAS